MLKRIRLFLNHIAVGFRDLCSFLLDFIEGILRGKVEGAWESRINQLVRQKPGFVEHVDQELRYPDDFLIRFVTVIFFIVFFLIIVLVVIFLLYDNFLHYMTKQYFSVTVSFFEGLFEAPIKEYLMFNFSQGYVNEVYHSHCAMSESRGNIYRFIANVDLIQIVNHLQSKGMVEVAELEFMAVEGQGDLALPDEFYAGLQDQISLKIKEARLVEKEADLAKTSLETILAHVKKCN